MRRWLFVFLTYNCTRINNVSNGLFRIFSHCPKTPQFMLYSLTMKPLNRTLCVAPMMAYTDRHFRYLLRLISKKTVLYTEMINANAIIHGDRSFVLDFDPTEHPVAIQLGGSDPGLLAKADKIAEASGYDEINLNVGCPSERVQNGC